MIHVDRSLVMAPPIFASKEIRDEIERLRLIFTKAGISATDAISASPFYSRFCKDQTIGKALQELFLNKCAYCESAFKHSSGAVAIEHFRPKIQAVNLNGEVSSSHYWWLTYQWSNLYLACDTCTSMKRNRFPVKGKRAPVNASEADVEREKALLLDPCRHQPEDHLVFESTGEVASKTEEGKATIKICGLNRLTLIRRRAEIFNATLSDAAESVGCIRRG